MYDLVAVPWCLCFASVTFSCAKFVAPCRYCYKVLRKISTAGWEVGKAFLLNSNVFSFVGCPVMVRFRWKILEIQLCLIIYYHRLMDYQIILVLDFDVKFVSKQPAFLSSVLVLPKRKESLLKLFYIFGVWTRVIEAFRDLPQDFSLKLHMVYLQILWQNFNYAQIVASRNYYMPVIYSSVAKLSSKSNANEIPQIKFGSIFPDSNGTSQDIAYIVSFLYIIVFIHIFISLLFVCAWFQVHNIIFSQPKNIFTLHFDFFVAN